MEKRIIIIYLSILLITIGFCGCTQEDSSSDTASSDLEITKDPEIQEQYQEPDSLDSIFDKAENINSMYYEISMDMDISEFGRQSALIKIWQKEPYIKEEIISEINGYSSTIMVIQNPDGTYLYDAEQDEYILSTDDVSSISTSLQYFDSDMILNSLSNQSLSNFNTDILDGKKTTVIEYSPTQDDDFIHVKIWIWNEKGVPLKGIVSMSLEEMNMDMEFLYSNYSFSDIPDSVFNIT